MKQKIISSFISLLKLSGLISAIIGLIIGWSVFVVARSYVTTPTTQETEKNSKYDANSLPVLKDNGDGTVTDTQTGLVWLKNAKCFTMAMNYNGAVNWVGTLASGECGLTDHSTSGQWRLPTAKELISLVNFKNKLPALSSGHPFSNVSDGIYWTSTPYAPDPSGAVTVNISNGFVLAMDKLKLCYTWPVR